MSRPACRSWLSRYLDDNARIQSLIKQARRDLLVAALLDSEFENRDVDITDDAISTYYYNHQELFERAEDEVWAEHILLANPRDANAVRQEVLQGNSFGDAAREHSLDRESGKRNGDLGYFSVDDDPILWEACLKLTIGKLSRSVPTERGHHIIRVLSRMQAGSVREIEHVRPQIVESLVREDYRRRLDELTERLKSANSWLIDEGQLTSLGI